MALSNFKQQIDGQLVQARPQDAIRTLLENNWHKIQNVMQNNMTSTRFLQICISSINQTPGLAEATPFSLLSCVMKCGALGLEPSAVDGLGKAYILPFKNYKKNCVEAQFIIGYRGIIELCRRSGKLKSIHAQAVYEGDQFDFWEDENGQHFTFRPAKNVPHDKDHMTDVYVAAHLHDGGRVIERMNKDEIEAIRNRSKTKDKGPWVTDYEAMALKTVIRRAAKYLPLSTQAQEAVAADETTPDYSGVFNPVVEIDAPVEQQQPEYDADSRYFDNLPNGVDGAQNIGSQAFVEQEPVYDYE